eukprot:CAMPEP_0184697464 /NCGR_PEP_ID=MMETSP0313-20130426/4428_1 /TAXON_ID=2792 /ORGANISM="Porphyridium aerugineum, Strain SAG 1380-2" /LENGTH=341 /DNA_ID=CAMNT_0027156271 /DNA_START=35 /DNA_END=1060 /DNA_ORIENTATION=+
MDAKPDSSKRASKPVSQGDFPEPPNKQFQKPSGINVIVEDLLKKDTVGLISLDEFKAKREYLVQKGEEEHAQLLERKRAQLIREKKELVGKRANKAALSFADEIDADSDKDEGEHDGEEDRHEESAPKHRKVTADPSGQTTEIINNNNNNQAYTKKLGKNPNVDTSFLPDRDRDLASKVMREKLKQEWMQEQERIKNEEIQITYSFWDGTGHRKTTTCTKGTSIGKFLAIAQQKFPQIHNVGTEMLMFIKEDLILPHHYTFYDFIVNKARGKSGPLFQFDAKEDIRMLADASREKEDSHSAKVVERRWYERNKHIFPASRWELYDPEKTYSKYTIHGGEVN